MSRLLSRVGSSAMKFQFELIPITLTMSIPLSTPLIIKWIRGRRTAISLPITGQMVYMNGHR